MGNACVHSALLVFHYCTLPSTSPKRNMVISTCIRVVQVFILIIGPEPYPRDCQLTKGVCS